MQRHLRRAFLSTGRPLPYTIRKLWQASVVGVRHRRSGYIKSLYLEMPIFGNRGALQCEHIRQSPGSGSRNRVFSGSLQVSVRSSTHRPDGPKSQHIGLCFQTYFQIRTRNVCSEHSRANPTRNRGIRFRWDQLFVPLRSGFNCRKNDRVRSFEGADEPGVYCLWVNDSSRRSGAQLGGAQADGPLQQEGNFRQRVRRSGGVEICDFRTIR